MELRQNEGRVVAEGTFLYDTTIECRVRIVFSAVRFGTGDVEDGPEIANDTQCDTYYVEYSSPAEANPFNSGGGGYPSLRDAKAHVESLPSIGQTVRWRA